MASPDPLAGLRDTLPSILACLPPRERGRAAIGLAGSVDAARDAALELPRSFCLEGSPAREAMWLLRTGPPALRSRRDLVFACIQRTGLALEHASAALRGDPTLVAEACKTHHHALQFAVSDVQGDRAVVRVAVSHHGEAIQFASEALQSDPEIATIAVANGHEVLWMCPPSMRAHKGVVLAAVGRNGLNLRLASPELKADRTVALKAVMNCGMALQYVAPELQRKELVLAAVRQDGAALAHAPGALSSDPAVVTAALHLGGLTVSKERRVAPNGSIYTFQEFLGEAKWQVEYKEKHRNCSETRCSELVGRGCEYKKKYNEANPGAAEDWRSQSWDGAAKWHAAQSHPGAAVPESLWSHREVVMAAVTQDGMALQHASEDLRSDPLVAMAAVRNILEERSWVACVARCDVRVWVWPAGCETVTSSMIR